MNREDNLIYRSVTFQPNYKADNASLSLKDNNLNQEVRILKMTQKFDLDPWDKNVEKQIKKFECNMEKKALKICYHYADGKITAKDDMWDRDYVITNNKGDDKQDESNFEQQQ